MAAKSWPHSSGPSSATSAISTSTPREIMAMGFFFSRRHAS